LVFQKENHKILHRTFRKITKPISNTNNRINVTKQSELIMYDIYTRPNCIWCIRAKDLLSRKGIEFNDLDITNDDLRNDLKSKAPGIKTIPQIFINGKRIGGYNDLVEHLKITN
jgi:glutaredoxin 3